MRLKGGDFGLLAALLACALAVHTLQPRVVEAHRAGQRYEDVYYLPDADMLPVLSLGYRDALADLLWCRSLLYFGEEILKRGQVQYLFAYTDAVLELDPSFKSAYRWVATAALYRPKAVSLDEGLQAAAYLARGVARWPDDGELQWDYASLLRFELAPLTTDAALRRTLFERAQPHMERAAELGAGPPWLALNNADLLNKLGRTEQAIRHLEELRDTMRDPALQKQIDDRLGDLRTQTYLEAMRTADAQFEAARQASFPYLSPALFFWVGTPTDRQSYDAWVAHGFASADVEE